MLCHPHDKNWIIETISGLGPQTSAKVKAVYSETYAALMDAAGDDMILKQAARVECNTRLRRYVEALRSQS